MNFNKYSYTTKDFLDLPVYATVKEAKVGERFLLEGRFSEQKKHLQNLLDKYTMEEIRSQFRFSPTKYIKIRFWTKLADGNVREDGGNIDFKEVDLVALKDGKLVIDTGELNKDVFEVK